MIQFNDVLETPANQKKKVPLLTLKTNILFFSTEKNVISPVAIDIFFKCICDMSYFLSV